MTEGSLSRRITGSTRHGRTNAVPIDEDFTDADVEVAPPAYGEHHDQLQFSQAGFAADAAVTTDGRVNIHINEKNQRLSELLAPALKRQLRADTPFPAGPLPPPYIPASLGGQPGQTPPPRLNVVIQIVGSRGDVQPFVALGQVLRDTYGHRVRLATHANFKSFVEENGLEFFNIGGDPAQLMAFMVKNPGLMPGLETLKNGDIQRRRQEIKDILMGCWRSCFEAGDGMGVAPPQHKRDEPLDERFLLPGDPGTRPFVADAIIANPPSFAHIHIAEKMGVPLHMMFTMPWTPTRSFPHPLADVVATNADAAITNYVSYALVEMMTWQGLGDLINRFRYNVLDLDPISLLWAPGLLTRLRIPTTYCWSPALTPKPTDWAPEITVSGFFFLDLETNYTPEPELALFLAAGPPPVYIGFGSIVVDDPDALTQTIFNAVIKSGVRAIVSKGWGGIGGDSAGVPEGVFMLGNCPHDWLFKQVAAVVHHGGAGTTAAGIRAGKPTVVVPFFGDQIFWGSMVAKSGAGPAPIPYKKLTAENLAAAIEFTMRPETQGRAQELGQRIKQEKGVDVAGKSFHQFLNTDNMRCSLAPSRVAVWRVRRSKVRLSALAAAIVVKQGWVKYSDLKLYSSIDYNTDEQPWDPISAVILAIVGDVGALTMAVADFPREIFKAQGKKEKDKAAPEDGTAKAEDAESVVTATPLLLESGSSAHGRADSGSAPASISSRATTHESAESLAIVQTSTRSLSGGVSPQPSRTPGTPPPLPSRTPTGLESPSTPSAGQSGTVNLDVAIAAGVGVGRIVGAGMKFYSNFCLGMARGFRNAPKLYNDDTVRPPEKVTGLVSGMKIAGKEFGLGMYDGTSGLFTQPWKGTEKEGAKGFVKGFGKGVGGFFFKNAAAVWALPAYTMQGLQAEVRRKLTKSSVNYIITSRVLQGEADLAGATAEETRDIMTRWHTKRDELKGFYLLKQKESDRAKEAAKAASEAAAVAESSAKGLGSTAVTPEGNPSAKTGRLGLPWNRRRTASSSGNASSSSTAGLATFPPTTASSAASDFSFEDHEALERAIRESVLQTSTGDREEDARVEAAMRESVMEMRRAAELQQQQQSHHQATNQSFGGWIADQKVAPDNSGEPAGGLLSIDEWTNITDEEYQALVEEAVRRSMMEQELEEQAHHHLQQQDEKHGQHANDRHHGYDSIPAEAGGQQQLQQQPTVKFVTDQQQQQELPGKHPTPSSTSNNTTMQSAPPALPHRQEAGEGEQEVLRRALEESERSHRGWTEEMARQRTEEEIVLEYVMKQSLAEEEFRRKGKEPVPSSRDAGVGQGQAGGGGEGEGDGEDEELRRAIEESLRISGGGGGGGGSGNGGSGPGSGPSRSKWEEG
ncbi:glycosyltransferase family 1 protein [Parathielavia hyrcaniae]|uniref:Glycosyltransferase family 1 protein n=1 Tax=Parathielavia hyrcaniae TaxID=113614 RepID=A0AAN6QDW9_9PEZI|nr:glycosyltransferase family 1 protein [Parathielavia hyrcaniae]